MKKSIGHWLHHLEIVRYSIAGVSSTIVDWAIFYVLAVYLSINYQFSVVVSLSLSAVVNYLINKYYTFKSTSRKVLQQFTIYFMLVLASLALSILMMHFFVDLMSLGKMASRVVTTMILGVFNYIMTKLIPFNSRFFA